jgi:peptidase E
MNPDPKPTYLLAGGRSSIRRRGPDPLIESALRLAGTNHPSVAYVGAASNDAAPFRAMIGELLREAGGGDVVLAPLCGRRANPEKARDVIDSSDIVFISGGDVEAGMKVLEEAQITGFLRECHKKGKPFFGASAGSIMLARSWVRWRDPDDDASAELFPCLGIAGFCCDTHGEEDGWDELRVLTRLVPAGEVTYGISSGAALVVHSDATVLARGGRVHRFANSKGVVTQIEPLQAQ